MALIWPAEVRLNSNRQPLANSSSATSTANGAPTAQPMMPTRCPPSVMRVIAGPGLAPDCLSRAAKMPNDVAVGIQNADGWDCGVRQRFLPPRFAQERARAEHRWHGRTLIVQD